MFLFYSSVISLSPERLNAQLGGLFFKYIIIFICLFLVPKTKYLAFTSIFFILNVSPKPRFLKKGIYLLTKDPLCSQPVIEVSRCKIFFCKHKTWWSYELVWKYFIFSNQSPFYSFYMFESKNLEINVFYSGTMTLNLQSYTVWYLFVTTIM